MNFHTKKRGKMGNRKGLLLLLLYKDTIFRYTFAE